MQDPRTVPGIDPELAAAILKNRALDPEGRLEATTAPVNEALNDDGDAVRAAPAT